jgi:hypothetical protein
MIIPIGINDLINEIKRLGFQFNLILRKASGSEPLVVGTLPMEDVREIVSRELTTPALTVATSTPSPPNLPELETSRAGPATSTPSPPNLSELETSGAGLSVDTSPHQSASTPKEDVRLIPERRQRVLSDSDDDFVVPGAAPPKPVKGRIILYHDLPEIERPYQELTDSAKRSFAAKILKGRRHFIKIS